MSDSRLASVLLSALLVFFLLVSDRTLDTLRLLFMMRGRKLLAGLVGFFQATIFLVAITQVLRHDFNAYTILGYAGGFATGVIVGMSIDDRLAMGFGHLRIISQAKGQAIADVLREAGHAATLLTGTGKDGAVSIVNCTVRRKDVKTAEELVQAVDPSSFVTVDEVRPLARGYFRY